MPIKEAIILAGGLGTRLRSVVAELPKCMAPVNGKPFIAYVTAYLEQQGIEKFIFSLGYKHEYFNDFLKEYLPKGNYQLATEDEPLGTGGAIKLACTKATEQQVITCNGDTLFKVNVTALAECHLNNKADCTLSLKPMEQFDRYGVVTLNADSSIASFQEKKYYDEGLINGGVYALNVNSFSKENLPEKFSFEKDYLEQYFPSRKMYGHVENGYFIDIGIPEDYARAQTELSL